MMDYISARGGGKLTNEMYTLTYDDIRTMYNENRKDEEECRRVTQSSYRGESYYADDGRPGDGKLKDFNQAFYKEILYRDMKTSGYMMQYPHGTVIRQGERNSYYRGENEIYLKSQPTIYRVTDRLETVEERQLYRIIADMRIAEFGIFLCRIGIVQFWMQNYGTVLFEPLAQHYGLETEWLDITSDFNVALFFATCYWDTKEKRWYPLTKLQTELTEAKKYGVLFHIPQENASLQLMTAGLDADAGCQFNTILPIGYQPFMRCHSQYAYGIDMKNPYPLQDDISFEKLKFRHNEKLSRDVYDMMNGGSGIYPQEGLDDFADVINQIKTAASFSEEAFNYAFGKNDYFSDADACKKALLESNVAGKPVMITGEKHPFSVSRQRIRRLNMRYQGFSVEKAYGIKLIERRVFYK